MDTHDFIARYAGIYEHSPWVAEQVAPLAADIDDVDRLAELLADSVLAPDAVLDYGTTDAAFLQGLNDCDLDRCSADELARFQALNEAYRDRFGFPFVMAVRGRNRREILDEFARRLDNSYQLEFETALQEIHKIARLRLDAMRARE